MKNSVVAHDLSFELLFSSGVIRDRVAEMGRLISERYAGRDPLFLTVLNGAFIFAADLIRCCDLDCEITFIKLSSYLGTSSSGKVSQVIGLQEDIEGRALIIVEDIIDTGRTLHTLLPELEEMKPASIEIATLLLKPDMLEFPLEVAYKGFEIPPRFVIGYGLDYDGLGRNLPGIYQLADSHKK